MPHVREVSCQVSIPKYQTWKQTDYSYIIKNWMEVLHICIG